MVGDPARIFSEYESLDPDVIRLLDAQFIDREFVVLIRVGEIKQALSWRASLIFQALHPMEILGSGTEW
jgi:hypothetical protein